MVLITLGTYLLLTTFVLRAYEVNQHSMEPTLTSGDRLLVDKISPAWDDYNLGDIVILQLPEIDGVLPTAYVKRIVGLPGDEIELRQGQVFRNGERLSEPYLRLQATLPMSGVEHWELGPDQYLVFGDNRDNSIDSRVFGPLPRSELLGRVLIRFLPFEDFGLVD
jgi:signal peptidase I